MSTHIISEDWPPTVDALIEAIEGIFDCRQGDPGRYVFLEDESKYTDPFQYKTIMYMARGRSPHRPKLLRLMLWNDFIALHKLAGGGKPVLYWRHAPPAVITEEVQRGVVFIRARIAIPSIAEWPESLKKEEGAMPREVA